MTSLYIHIPFSEKKCFYCSFVFAVGREHRIDSYLECLALEAKRYQNTELKTIYAGGGTPTSMGLTQLKKLFSILKENFQFPSDCELTIEANPKGLDLDKAKLLSDCGVNRVSLGVQSLNDRYLKYLGRAHDSRQAIKAFENLRKAGFANINLDLMYSFPGQTQEGIREDVHSIARLGSEHLSLYTLTIEENSRFYARQVQLEDGAVRAKQYSLVVSLLKQTEFEQYEISNFAKLGFQSRHNLNYWQGGDYIGLGVGAHSHFNGERFWNVSRMNLYISRLNSDKTPREGGERLSGQKQLMERILLGLRMNEGVNVAEVTTKLGLRPAEQKQNQILEFVKEGFLRWEKDHLCTTLKGRLVLDEISSRLI